MSKQKVHSCIFTTTIKELDSLDSTFFLSVPCRFEFQLKSSGWGGGGTRKVKFERGNKDGVVYRPGRKLLTVLVGPGLDPNAREFIITRYITPSANVNIYHHVLYLVIVS
jgi:hypothetical protein